MLGEVMAALKAIPEIARALRDISGGIKDATSSRRKEEKDLALETFLAAARARRRARLPGKETSGTGGDNPGEPTGVG